MKFRQYFAPLFLSLAALVLYRAAQADETGFHVVATDFGPTSVSFLVKAIDGAGLNREMTSSACYYGETLGAWVGDAHTFTQLGEQHSFTVPLPGGIPQGAEIAIVLADVSNFILCGYDSVGLSENKFYFYSAVSLARNLSTRGQVSPEFPMHGGIVVEGDVKVLITGRGLSTGLATALDDPKLQLFMLRNGQPPELLTENDDWQSNSNASDIQDLTLSRPLNDSEPALFVNLSSGAYTAVVRDSGGAGSGEVVLGFTVVD